MMVWGKSANANVASEEKKGRRRVIIGNGSAGDRPLFTVSVDPGDEPERRGVGGVRQPTWQPLSPHQAVADCDGHPGDRGVLAASGTSS